MNKPSNLVLAHRYLYYVLARPIITDRAYDELERQLPEDDAVRSMPGSDRATDYTDEVIALAESLLTDGAPTQIGATS